MLGISLNVINESLVQIRCEYLVGVVISGCIYTLVPSDLERDNITGTILRINGDEQELNVDGIGCYSELVGTVAEDATNLLSLPRRRTIERNSSYSDCIEFGK